MELILMVGGLLLLDILAMRFGVDSRILDSRDRQELLLDGTTVARLAGPSAVRRTSLRIRLADGLRALAVRIEPTACVPSIRAL
jgi:hypothetical protein